MSYFQFNNDKKVTLFTPQTKVQSKNENNEEFINTVYDGYFDDDNKLSDNFKKSTPSKTIPKQNLDNNGREYVEHNSVHIAYSQPKDDETYASLQEKYLLRIKKSYRQKFPINQYDIEVSFNGKYYDVFVYDKATQPKPEKISGEINTVRDDGIKFQIKDNYEGDIYDDDNSEWIDIRRQNPFEKGLEAPKISITDKNGKQHSFYLVTNNCTGLLDLRRQEHAIADFLKRLPAEKIQEMIDNNVRDITILTEPDDEFPELYNTDKNGECVVINEGGAEFVSPTFMPPEHKYHTEQSFRRDDNSQIFIEDSSKASSDLTITNADGNSQTIALSSNTDDYNTDIYHQILLPKLKDILKNVSPDVLQDFSAEINEVKIITDNLALNGNYPKGSNTLVIDMYDDDARFIHNNELTFIHELGHAIDNVGNRYLSAAPEFLNKYNEFTELAQKYEYESIKDKENISIEEYKNGRKMPNGIIDFRNHSLDSEKEMFASIYANMNYTGKNDNNNHIKGLDKVILPLKDSKDTKAQRCYQLYQELKNYVKNKVGEVRALPKEKRSDNNLKNLVRTKGQDILQDIELLTDKHAIDLIAYSPELTLINILGHSDKEFKELIDSYEQNTKDDSCPDDIKKAFTKIIPKLKELRSMLPN